MIEGGGRTLVDHVTSKLVTWYEMKANYFVTHVPKEIKFRYSSLPVTRTLDKSNSI